MGKEKTPNPLHWSSLFQDWVSEYLPSLLSRHHQGHLHISGSVSVEEMQLFSQTLVEHKSVLLRVTINYSTNPVSVAHSQ